METLFAEILVVFLTEKHRQKAFFRTVGPNSLRAQ